MSVVCSMSGTVKLVWALPRAASDVILTLVDCTHEFKRGTDSRERPCNFVVAVCLRRSL
jgi:hypothetical protein